MKRLLDDSARETELWRLDVLCGRGRVGRRGSAAFLSTEEGIEVVGEGRESRLERCTLTGRLVSILSNLCEREEGCCFMSDREEEETGTCDGCGRDCG